MIPNCSVSLDQTTDLAGQSISDNLPWRLLTTLLTGLVCLFGMAMDATAGESHRAFFAEPTSGRKVTHYSIELPVKRGERQSFNIPDDCSEVVRLVNGGATFKGNIVDRGLWKKTEGDCRYHGFLNRHPQRVIEDYVSDYDFRNARLADLPLDRRCADTQPEPDPARCNPTATNDFGMLRHFPIATPVTQPLDRVDCIPCELNNGRFRGYVLVTETGAECKTDANAPGVRLIAVDFADINGDQVLDAVLRFIPIGPANNRAPLILPLTKLDASAPFSVPAPMRQPKPMH